MGFDLIPTETFDLLVFSFQPNGVRHISPNAYDSNLSIISNHFVYDFYSLELIGGLFIHGFLLAVSSLFEFFLFG